MNLNHVEHAQNPQAQTSADWRQAKRVLLAYSGGLDTTVLIPWLKEQGIPEVICAAGDVGQIDDPEALKAKALQGGADDFVLLNLREAFVSDYVFPCIQAGARYEGTYLLGTAMARPIIAKALVELAHERDCHVIVHGCTGKGNDQVRFELTMYALDPSLQVVAPWRFWDLTSRSAEIAYLKAHGIDREFSPEAAYSMDENLWHLSHEGLDLEDPKQPADMKKILHWCTPLEETPDTPETVTITFKKGRPVAVNGQTLAPVELLQTLNAMGAKHGIGVDDLVESRLVGMKSRGVYENPAGTILYAAHDRLETLTLDADTLHFKQPLSYTFADLVYNGKWETTLFKSLLAFVESTQETVNGTVTCQLFKGHVQVISLDSEDSLFSEGHATFEQSDCYDHADATGFIRLYGLSMKIKAQLNAQRAAQKAAQTGAAGHEENPA